MEENKIKPLLENDSTIELTIQKIAKGEFRELTAEEEDYILEQARERNYENKQK
jgi:hypothetical protein